MANYPYYKATCEHRKVQVILFKITYYKFSFYSS